MPNEVVVVVESHPVEMHVDVEPPPVIQVSSSQTGLRGPAGPPGPEGPPGISSTDASAEALQEHVDSPTPHPAYDDAPSFVLLYQNAKV